MFEGLLGCKTEPTCVQRQRVRDLTDNWREKGPGGLLETTWGPDVPGSKVWWDTTDTFATMATHESGNC